MLFGRSFIKKKSKEKTSENTYWTWNSSIATEDGKQKCKLQTWFLIFGFH